MARKQKGAASKKTKRRGRWWKSLRGLLVVLCLAAAGTAYYAYEQLQPPTGNREPVDFTIQSGESAAAVASDLKRVGLIKNPFFFRMYLKYRDPGVVFLAGHYKLERGSEIPELIAVIAEGKVINAAIPVTIPEGYTVAQVADRLSQEGICDKTEFLKEVQTGTFDEPFLKDLPKSKNIKYRLEGYLFPDTYQFEKHESAHAVVDSMLKNFSNHVGAQMQADMKAKGLTLPQVVTEASLVEKEARVEPERPIIASVIQNRMKKSMKLQIDATLEYILGHRDVLTIKDTEVADPYNTYKYTGLPPGPIANPGIESIDAVVHPASTKYLYYVVKNDGTGEHYFSLTFNEQLHNEALSQQNLKAHSH